MLKQKWREGEYLAAMHLILALFFALCLPSLEDGRVSPKENAKCLPAQFQPERWYGLEFLENEENFTLFSDAAYQQLRVAYLSENEVAIEQAYWVAYAEIAGKRLHLSSHSILQLPQAWELKLERFYLDFPWALTLSAGFLIALFFPPLFFDPLPFVTCRFSYSDDSFKKGACD